MLITFLVQNQPRTTDEHLLESVDRDPSNAAFVVRFNK